MSLPGESARYPLVLWNDCAIEAEMKRAVTMGCRGGTSNPPLILKAAKSDAHWAKRAADLGADRSPKTAARLLADEIRIAAARKLMPVYTETGGREGRLSVQVDPRNHEDVPGMVAEARELFSLAPNLSVKIPLTAAGLIAMRQLLELGIWVTATVSFTTSQVLAVTQLYSDFLSEWRGDDPPGLFAVLMVGRVDDYLTALNEERGLGVPGSVIAQAGVAVARRTYKELRARGLSGTLLLAAPRGLHHITEFLTMDAIMTAGPAVRDLAYQSPELLQPGSAPTKEAFETLRSAFPEFVQAYEPEGLSVEEFLTYGATQRTLAEFVAAQTGLEAFVSECAERF